jgi:hypothetical protein
MVFTEQTVNKTNTISQRSLYQSWHKEAVQEVRLKFVAIKKQYKKYA